MKTTIILLVFFVIGLAEVSLAGRNGRPGRGGRGPRRNTTDAPECPPRRRPCTKDCGTLGFMKSEEGCELCACNSPSADCPAIECPDSSGVCPNGHQEDEMGCRLCECKINLQCGVERLSCTEPCPQGFINGPDGCPTCKCFDPATATVGTVAAAAADDEFVTLNRAERPARTRPGRRGVAPTVPSSESSDTSSDNTATCPPVCMVHCHHGLKLNDNGCPTCECNNPSTAAGGPRHGHGHGLGHGDRHGHGDRRVNIQRRRQCLQPRCAMFCPNGYKRSDAGCTLCECHQPGDATIQTSTISGAQCQQLRCHRHKQCANGFATSRATGCPSCVCQATPGVYTSPNPL